MKNPQTLRIRGTLTFCPVDPVRPCGKYVYQGVRAGLGNVPADRTGSTQLRRWVKPADPRSAPQLARRAAFAAAVLAWRALTPEQQRGWRRLGEHRRLPGYQTFLSAYLRA